MKKAIIAVTLIGLIGLVYYYLGGTSEIEVKQMPVSGYEIAGIQYEGRYRDTALEETFFSVKSTVQNGQLTGELVVINYPLQGDSTEQGFVSQFIGVQLEHPVKALPEKFTIKKIEASSVISAAIKSHNLVMPSPDDIEDKIHAYADKEGLQLVNYTIEKYVSDRNLIVEIPVKEYE